MMSALGDDHGKMIGCVVLVETDVAVKEGVRVHGYRVFYRFMKIFDTV